MLESIFSSTSNNIDLISLLICILTSICLGLLISFIHMKTSKYTKNFIVTLALLPTLISIVIIMVNGNLGTSVAVLGAFSLIRFRSVPGNSKEIASVFFAMAIGLAVGMGQIVFAIITTVIISFFLIILNNFKFGLKNNKNLTILVPENLDYTNIFDDIFSKYVSNFTLEKVKTTNMGSLFELNYNLQFKDNINEKDFIDELRCRNGNLKIVINHTNTEGEL